MSKKHMAILAVIAVFISFGAASGSAKGASDTHPVISVQGDISADGKLLTLTLEPGAIVTHAIRVYSEPSHTLLAVMIDSDFGLRADTWRSSWIEVDRPLSVITTDLPHAKPRVHVVGRPDTDDRVAVYVYGTWPDGSVGETLVSDAKVGKKRSFAFSTSIVESKDKGPTEYEHCCENATCGRKCKTCSEKAFECCLLEGCCWIECGWSNPSCTCAECTC